MDEITQQLQQEQAKLEDILRQQREALNANNLIQLEKEGLEASVTRVQGDISKLEERKTIVSNDLDAATVSLAKKYEALGEVDSQIVQKNLELETKKREYDEFVIALQQKKQDFDRETTQLKAQHAQIKQEFEQDMVNLRKEHDTLSERKQSIVGDFNAAQQKLDTENERLNDKKEEYDELIDAVSSKVAEHELLESSIEKLRKELSSLEESLVENNSKLLDLVEKVSQTSNTLTTIQEEVKNNDTKNKDFIELRATVMREKDLVDQRMAFLKQQYVDFNFPW